MIKRLQKQVLGGGLGQVWWVSGPKTETNGRRGFKSAWQSFGLFRKKSLFPEGISGNPGDRRIRWMAEEREGIATLPDFQEKRVPRRTGGDRATNCALCLNTRGEPWGDEEEEKPGALDRKERSIREGSSETGWQVRAGTKGKNLNGKDREGRPEVKPMEGLGAV